MKRAVIILCLLFTVPLLSKTGRYTFHLTDSDYKDKKNRKTVENFLCSMIPGLINSENIKKRSAYKPLIDNPVKLLRSTFIDKWHEERVIYKLTGEFSESDIETVREFFNRINKATGYNQFVQNQKAKIANILIHFNSSSEKFLFYSVSGESSLPGVNWLLRLKYNKGKVEWEKILTEFKGDFKEYSDIKFTREELEFARKERLVKVVIGNSIKIPYNSPGRKRTIIHELLHGTGFAGHSPFYKSALFPTGNLNEKYNDKFTMKMVDNLYRPDVFPGMNLLEVEKIIRKPFSYSGEKLLKLLKQQKILLELKKRRLLNDVTPLLKEEFEELVKLSKLSDRENYLYDELREVHSDQNLSVLLIDIIASADNLKKKLGLTMAEKLKVKKKLEELKRDGSKGTKKEILLLKDRLYVLEDIPKAIVRTHAQKVKAERMRNEEAPITKYEKELRNIVIQLNHISSTMNNLIHRNASI